MRERDLTRRKFLSAGTAAAGAAALRSRTLGSRCHEASGGVLVDDFAVGRALVPNADFNESAIRIKLGIPTQFALETTATGGKLWWSNFTYKELEEQLEQMAKNCLLASGADATAAQLEVKWKSTELSASEFDALHAELIAAFASYAAEAGVLYEQQGREMKKVVYLDASGFEVSYKTSYQEFTASGVQDTKQKANLAMITWLHHLDAIAATRFKHAFPDVLDERS
jgi:hypothetical protein